MAYNVSFKGYNRPRVPMADGDGELPETYEVAAVPDDEDDRPAVHFSFHVVDGVPRCREVRFVQTDHGREVRRSDYEDIGLESWLQEATARMLRPHVANYDENGGLLTVTYDNTMIGQLRKQAQYARRGATGRGPSEDDLRRAAEIYQSAERAPTQAVADHFDIKHRTASLWIKRAREKGLM